MTDPIADMIIRIKNAVLAGKDTVSVPYSGFKYAIAEKLKRRGYVSELTPRGKKSGKTIELVLARTAEGIFRVSDVRRISRPGRRVYVGAADLKPVRGGTGTQMVSTSKGVFFGDEARKDGTGGELLFEIW